MARSKYDTKTKDDQALRDAYDVVAKHTLYPLPCMASLWENVQRVDQAGIPGVLVECGVWRGGSMGMMAQAHMQQGQPASRELHLFDSFQGYPRPSLENDGQKAVSYFETNLHKRTTKQGNCEVEMDVSRELLDNRIAYPESLIHFHPGWFQDTIPPIVETFPPIAILRLDADWYDSVKTCLDYLFPKISPGGVLIFNGYWPGCRKAVDECIIQFSQEPQIDRTSLHCSFFVKK